MGNINISEATIALIDSLKSTTGAFGLAGTGSEYKIVTEMFLYKIFIILPQRAISPLCLMPHW